MPKRCAKADSTHSGGGRTIETNRQINRNEDRTFRGTSTTDHVSEAEVLNIVCDPNELSTGCGEFDRGIGEIRAAGHQSNGCRSHFPTPHPHPRPASPQSRLHRLNLPTSVVFLFRSSEDDFELGSPSEVDHARVHLLTLARIG